MHTNPNSNARNSKVVIGLVTSIGFLSTDQDKTITQFVSSNAVVDI